MPPIGTSQAADEFGSGPVSRHPGTADHLIYDVGLDRGEDAAFYLALGYDVVGFVADQASAEHCRTRFAREIGKGRLTILDGAVVGLRATLESHGVPHFMKVGSRAAVRPCLETLASAAKRPRFVSIESATSDWEELIAEFDLLEALGYGRFAVVERSKVSGQIVRTSDRFGGPLEYRFKSGSSGAFGGDLSPWLRRDAALARYKKIFRSNRSFGEDASTQRWPTGRSALDLLPRIPGRARPGSYDIHAMLSH